MVAVVEHSDHGSGLTAWLGELRDANDDPIPERASTVYPMLTDTTGRGVRFVYPVSVGQTQDEVLALLRIRAAGLSDG
jgi:hypothetical protein